MCNHHNSAQQVYKRHLCGVCFQQDSNRQSCWNRNLEFGIRNILEEFLQEKDYDLNPESKSKVSVEVVYLDVLKTKSNLSVFHKNEESVVIRLKGILKVDGKKIKEVIVEEESSEISMSTLAVDNGGQFNQQSLSNAIKKACEKLVDKLFETK